MKTSPLTFCRIGVAMLLLLTAPWASGQLVQTLLDINPTAVTESTDPDEMVQAAGTLYIATDSALTGSELYKFTVLAAFQNARGVTVDANGVVYVADTSNHVIRKITTDGVVTTLAGAVGMTGNIDGTGLAARFTSPEGIAVVASGPNVGTLFVADTGNHTIRRISPEGSVSTLAGRVISGSGVAGFADNNNPGDAQFRNPRGIAVRPVGNNLEVYVSDSGNHTIRKIEILAASSAVTSLAGNGTQPPGSVEGTGTAARFNNPGGLALDNVIDNITGRPSLYVADTGNHRVRKVGLGGTASAVAGSGTSGNANGTGVAASFNAPQGVACDAATTSGTSNIYIADTGNNLVRRIQISSSAVTTLAGSGTAGSTDGVGTAASFNAPRGMTFRGTEVIVADAGNHTLRTLGVANGAVTLRAGQPSVSGSRDGASTGVATPAPVQVRDILPGAVGSLPQELTAVGTTVFFAARDANGDRDLWKTDGTTAGTVRVGNTSFPNNPDGPTLLKAVGNTLFFQGYSSDEGPELWKSDGTTVGTVMVKDINPGGDGSLMENLYNANGTLLLGASNGTTGVEMWRSNGTDTTLVKDLFTDSVGSNPSGYLFFNNTYYFTATSDFVDVVNGGSQPVGRELFKLGTNLTAPATTGEMLVADLDPLLDSEPRELIFTGPNTAGTVAGVGGQMFFSASGSTTGRELYVMNFDNGMDPTLVKDMNASVQDSGVEHLTPITVTTGNPSRPHRVLFTADEGLGQGLELYSSDGTVIGTGIVKDLTPAEGNSILNNFIPLSSGLVVFTKEDPTDQTITLWRTDGTEPGTVQIENFATEGGATPSLTSKDFRAPVRVGANLYFMLGHDELWVTNGQNDFGTFMVHRFRTSTASSESQEFTRLSDGRIIFSAVTPDHGREPWVSNLDGVTELIQDMRTGPEGSEPQDFTPTDDGRAFFSAGTSGGDREVYSTNGDTVTPLPEINAFGSAEPENFFWNQGKLYFAARDGGLNTELWVLTSPPEGGATLGNIEINLDETGSFPDHFIAYKDLVYFSAITTAGRELWRTNGVNTAGTVLFKDIATGTQSSDPDEFVVMPAPKMKINGDLDYTGTKLYFIAMGSGNGATAAQETGRELWVTDGTAANTTVVKDILPGSLSAINESMPAYLTLVGTNTLYFVADDGTNGRELWKSNGTPAGTVMVTDINKVGTVGGPTDGSDPTDLKNVNGKLFFIANDGVNGRELWVSDGTTGGTRMVNFAGRTGLVTGMGDADIQDLTVIQNVVCFTADDGVSGREVWISDGTTTGTYIVTEFVQGAGSSYPHNLAAAGAQLIFSASDDLIGDEPRQAFLSSKLVVEQPVDNALSNNVSVVDFTPVTPVNFGSAISLTIRLKNVGIIGIEKIAASISGLHATDFTVKTKPAPVLLRDGMTTMTVEFKPKEGGARTAKLLISSTDVDNPMFTITLSGDCSKDATVGTQPVHQMVKVGAPLTLTSTSAGGTLPITIQWRKNGAAVAGATSNPFYLWAAKLADAGAYTALFKTGAAGAAGTAITDVAQVGVVEDFVPARVLPVKTGTASTKLTVNAAGNNLTYLWKFSTDATLINPQSLSALTGFNTKTLTITSAQLATGYYFCEVTGPGGTVVGGTTYVKVFNAAPVLTPIANLPVAVVGTPYFHQVQVDQDPLKTPVTFGALKLPTGLKIDPKTGIISGVITTKPKVLPVTVVVTLTVTNGIKNGASATISTNANLKIIDLPVGLNGVFQGLVERNEEINGSAGGRIEITTTTLGGYSGKLTLGAITYPFKGNLNFPLDSNNNVVPPYTAMVRIPRTGIAAPLDLSFTIDDVTKNHLSAGQIASVNVGGPVTAAVSGWKVTTNIGHYFFKGAGNVYNFGIKLPATVNAVANPNIGNIAVPQGDGYGSFTVTDKGVATIAGMTADGEKITCATFVGPNGEVLLYQSLYGTVRKGAVAGLLSLSAGADMTASAAALVDNVITTSPLFDFDWTRPPATAVLGTATTSRTYRAGFGLAGTPVVNPVELEAFGGYYQPGAHLLQILTGSTTADNASLSFTGAGVDLARLEPDAPYVSVNLSTAKVPTTPAPGHPAKTKIGTAVLKTGLFSGDFALADDDITTTTPAALNGKLTELARVVKFLGLIVPEAGNHRGVGYFVLPQIPPAAGATPAKTAPILSGRVNFDND